MNNVVLSGRLVKDPDVHYLKGDNSNAVLRYTMAVTRDFKNADGKYDTDFISCVAWDRNAEFISKHFKKGSPSTIGGDIRTGNYTNKEGQKVYTTDVFTDKIDLSSDVCSLGKIHFSAATCSMSAVKLLHGSLSILVCNKHQISDIGLGPHDSALNVEVAILVGLGTDRALKSHGYYLYRLSKLKLGLLQNRMSLLGLFILSRMGNSLVLI